jgi:hypothetical protein
MPETTSNRAQEEFILSIRGLDDSWAATQLQDLIKKEQKDEDFSLITDLIAEFRSYYRRTRPIASGLSTFATLEVAGANNHGAPLAENHQPSRVESWILKCLDGELHKFNNCLYVNQSVRTRGWKPDQVIQAKFTELRLPPPPKRWRDLEKHLFRREFIAAASEEFKRCQDIGCFKTILATEADTQILPLMWVFTYKFDEDGLLYKYKARLVVRGDL